MMPTEPPHPPIGSEQPAPPIRDEFATPPGASTTEGLGGSAVTPPTQPGQLGTRGRRKSWPGVLGTIAIIFGVLGILGGILGIFELRILRAFSSALPKNAAMGLDAYDEWSGWIIVLSVFSLLVAVLLLVAGIGLFRRRGWSVKIVRCWAVLKIVRVLVTAAMIDGSQAQDSFDRGWQAGGGAVMPAHIGQIVSVIIIGVTILWGWALPVFMLIWLSRRTVREEYREWS